MRVKHISINNFIGIKELTMDLGKVNVITGKKGSGKTSIAESIQKAFTNKSERTEIIRHGEDEATIFVQTDTGLEIDRKIRTNKTDYLKVRQPGEAVPSSEKFLKQFYNGDIFKPLEFVSKSPTEQAKIILNLLDIPWTMDDIQNWFGECPSVNYESHILQVLGQIVSFYFEQRASINSEIVVLKAQIAGYRNELPPNYDGNEWREKKVAEYYKAVHDAEQVNKSIDTAKNLIEGLEGRIATVKAEAETEKEKGISNFNIKRNVIKDFKLFLDHKVEKATEIIAGIAVRIEASEKSANDELAISMAKANAEYQTKLQELKEQNEREVSALISGTGDVIGIAEEVLRDEESKAKDDLISYKSSMVAKDQEFENIDALQDQFILSIDEKTAERIKTEDAKVGNARKTLSETTAVNVEPLTLAADQLAHMQSYLRDYDLMASIIREKLSPKEDLSKTLTARIEKGREMPKELLKIATLPIPGITVDSDGLIRIGETLVDGLSEGEQLELAFRVAKAQAGELKLICLDGWSKINPSDREWIEKEIAEDEFQYLILETTNGELEVNIEGEIK